MRVLGIDPGFGRLGVAVIEGDRGHARVLMHDCIETSPKLSFLERLLILHSAVAQIIDTYQPNCMGLEKLFFFKNQKTAMDVAHVRGMLMASAGIKKIPIREFTPLQVKQTLAGYGRADKRQIQKMIQMVFKLKEAPKLDDAADALAIAWCALQWK
ncbi:MAG: Crossover junction endodeoxyribonuclease RuvC [Candidatus Magasanikbacteria bacterium GW2011_GWA2_45_39]|uniref:Crossover junction endodeoxyribonuclease RuvC n=2 Tax=Candidatus Magasanikiibacteriota TaxID=1752731 RepID=A0A0G1N0B7_9BACT|nr:MAG: Crossover junction endodeoxyribonuclease RuvC [Candidatus Magasanikbacteria bacterium GW2011_GWA2_45_39]KKU13949.1 MAG: Crossover junction endodeoxyribonuclease RuvC [Candidatus Magasanikbacteria bacterium GW2011_GWC2_45_8]HBW74104.1 crossover junction endodeoxyribonuclease RuvC [Candidatus Magasanikbacteria bacterium]